MTLIQILLITALIGFAVLAVVQRSLVWAALAFVFLVLLLTVGGVAVG